MHCVQTDRTEELHAAFAGVPLTVVFAEGATMEAVRSGATRALPLVAPFHVSDEDAYLVLPDDIGMEIVDIVRDGDLALLHESMRDGLLVVGEIARAKAGVVELRAEAWISAADALARGLPYAETISVAAGDPEDLVDRVNELDHLQITMASALLDDDGLESMLRQREWAGTSWRVPEDAPARLRGAEPTYAWSRRLASDRVGVELALFAEYEEIVVLLRPVLLAR
jgi:hypothetical protein